MKIYAYLREGSWGFIKHCTSQDIFAFTLKNRLCTEAAILNLDMVLGLHGKNWTTLFTLKKTNLFVFSKMNLLANLCCPWRSVAGIPISWQRAAHSSISNVKPAIVLPSTQAHLKQQLLKYNGNLNLKK